ncbi:hypothetical protein KJ713_03690 [Patescibacteria group bacterium]|nr:hypothetical protein [Patescibacteria group bacterium]
MAALEKFESGNESSEDWEGWKEVGGIGPGKAEDAKSVVWEGDGKERFIYAVYDYSSEPHSPEDRMKFGVQVDDFDDEYDPETEKATWWLKTCEDKDEVLKKSALARELYSKFGPNWKKIKKELEK